MSRFKPYSEKTKIIEVIEGIHVPVYVVDDLDDEELLSYFIISLEKENFEHCQALAAEALARKLKLPPI